MEKKLKEAKEALDKIIIKGRVHLYKPIHIGEILYYSRKSPEKIRINKLETYRTISRKWRDIISLRLVGNKSTSSSRYQDDVFNENAMPIGLLEILDIENKDKKGSVEAYIYKKLGNRLSDVAEAFKYLTNSTVDNFELTNFINFFEKKPGLKRSIDKAYEIVVYALFTTLVDELKVNVSLNISKPDPELLKDFKLFVEYVLGVNEKETRIIRPAKIYRGGVANAADRGIDMWTNFGPAVQVKHLRLDQSLADEITDNVATDDVVIVCKTAEATLLKSLLNQIGKPIRGIITQDDLNLWFKLCLKKYKMKMGKKILNHLINEFIQEFPSLNELIIFMEERGYNNIEFDKTWSVDEIA